MTGLKELIYWGSRMALLVEVRLMSLGSVGAGSASMSLHVLSPLILLTLAGLAQSHGVCGKARIQTQHLCLQSPFNQTVQ